MTTLTAPTTQRKTALPTGHEWSAYCAGVEDGIQTGYAQAMDDILHDLRQASHALIDDGWIPETIRQHATRTARATSTSYIPRQVTK